MPFTDYWAGSSFPPVRTLLGSPADNFSRGRTVTPLAGSVAVSAFPLLNATDDTAQSVSRLTGVTGGWVVDLGSARSPLAIAVFNHTFDEGRVIGTRGSNNSDLSSAVVSAGFAAAPFGCWLDLRGFSFVPARYWSIEIETVNSVALQLGEIVIALPDAYEGVIMEESLDAETTFYQSHERSEHGARVGVTSGVASRRVQMRLRMSPAERVAFEGLWDEAGLTWQRVLVVPDSRVNECYWVDWPVRRETAYDKTDRFPETALALDEEGMGV